MYRVIKYFVFVWIVSTVLLFMLLDFKFSSIEINKLVLGALLWNLAVSVVYLVPIVYGILRSMRD